jgi:hypothetical protein
MKEMRLRDALLAIAVALVCAGCSSIQGTYADPTGAFVLDLKSGGQATFSFGGQAAPCTYDVNGKSIALACQGADTKEVLTIQGDGSLAGPPGSPIPPLRKK